MSDTFSADSKVSGGAVTAPGAGATIAAVTGLQAGSNYRVVLNIDMTGTVDVTNIQNLKLTSGGANVVPILPSVAGMFPIIIDNLHVPAADLTLVAIAAFGAASILSCTLVATRVG